MSVEVNAPWLFAATLTEDPTSGGDLVIADTRPGIVGIPQRPLVVSDLITPGSTSYNSVAFMKESAFTNAAAAVAEGAAKPESTLTFDASSSSVRKIAHWLPVSEEVLDDVANARSHIDARLRLGVQLAEDDMLLNGDGVAPNLLGFRNLVGLAPTISIGTGTALDAIARALAQIEVLTNLKPSGVVLHPNDWLNIQLLKVESGEYLAANPFERSPDAPTIWGVPRVVTSKQPEGEAFVGAFSTGGAQLFRRGGLRVDSTNAHANFFTLNLVAIRSELREALVVYRSEAFGKVDLTP